MKSAKDLQAAFSAYHKAHPEIYEEFKRRVSQLWNSGKRHYSADGILHVIRFHTALTGKPRDSYKINNNFSSFYVRLWQKEHPERADFFETRAQKSIRQSNHTELQYL
jgi:hypothetical protein